MFSVVAPTTPVTSFDPSSKYSHQNDQRIFKHGHEFVFIEYTYVEYIFM